MRGVVDVIFGLMGYSKPSSPTAEPRRHHKSLSVDESMMRARSVLQSGVANGSTRRTGVATNDAIGDTNETQQRKGGSGRPAIVAEDVLASIEGLLTECEHELGIERSRNDKLESENLKLKEKYTRLRTDASDQVEVLKKHKARAEFLNPLVSGIITKYLSPYAKAKHLGITNWTPKNIDAVLEPQFLQAMEFDSMRDQIRILQNELLAKVDKVSAIPDEQFAKDFRSIIALVKTLSRSSRFTDGVDVVESLGSCTLAKDVSRHHWDSRSRKKYLVEAWVWSVLIGDVFRSPFTIFGKQCDEICVVWMNLFGAEHHQGLPCPSSPCETWRRATTEHLVQFLGRDMVALGEPKQQYPYQNGSVFELRANVTGVIQNLTKISPTTDISQVDQIVTKAFTLAMEMSLQRSRLQVTYPAIGANFNEQEMSSMPDPNGEDIDEGVVAFIVNPGLTKWGDAHGKHLDQRYDIVPTLVQLEHMATMKQTDAADTGVEKCRVSGDATEDVYGKNRR
ncbi:hypothetical protein P153DRAFT_430627 [Dothidotthia symphoricarpi CBS 119687]|uniref:Uncharacterized protein n=1 Tax=Dothidotthia symphoricarpi CBS 119687 TaxID=1392245 RepID=A0A6A6AHR4_9PLEO|nr:uncharacterized protein P153DRAFT_430627 [Dothidotthia symphoricarpi CBS 119687]KAF2130414.1 hypothetical protein P153DRAFT_430627 [Dothidotthia symphoricarpi CBS 119687]